MRRSPPTDNNVFILPALGLAIYATEAKTVTYEMLPTASEAVAEQITEEDFSKGLIYPPIKNIKEVSVNVAVKVDEEIFRSGLARIKKPKNIRRFIKSKMYESVYK